MRTRLIIFFFFISFFCKAQIKLEWQKNFGGSNDDTPRKIITTSDGGYIIAGYSTSFDGDARMHSPEDNFYSMPFDTWIVKTNAKGTIEWQKFFGGKGNETGYSILETDDKGFLIAAVCTLQDSAIGDTIHQEGGHFYSDAWLIKTDSKGNIEWQKCIGGLSADVIVSIVPGNNCYYLAGSTYSEDLSPFGFHGYQDSWVVCIGKTGNIRWQKCYGGKENDETSGMIKTSDGCLLLCGSTSSSDGDLTVRNGVDQYDYWVVKLDTSGNIKWQKKFGGTADDHARSITETSDSCFVVTGTTLSSDGDVSGIHMGKSGIAFQDIWTVKFDAMGNIIWQRTLGSNSWDEGFSVIADRNSGCIIGGWAAEPNGDVIEKKDGLDMWLISLDKNGQLRWQKTFGGSQSDFCLSLTFSQKGKQLVSAGCSRSSDGDLKKNNGHNDFWITCFSLKK